MKTNRLICTVAVALTLSSFSASAQMQGPQRPEGRPGAERPQMKLTPRQRAEQRTDEMDKAVSLDDKQYKKIYKIFLKEENAKEAAMENGGPMGPPPGGMGGGRPPQGGGFPGGSGMGGGFPGGPGMGGGFSGGPGAGGPPSGMPFPGGFGEPKKPVVGGKEIDSDEYIDAREEKFRKILSAEQYATWRKLHPDPSGFFFE